MLDIITSLIWICHYACVTFSKSCVSTQFQNHHFPLWYQNDTVFVLFGLVYPHRGLLGYPLLASVLPRHGTCHPDNLASHPVPHFTSFSPFFRCNNPNPSFNHIFQIYLLNMLNQPHFSKHSCLIQQFRSTYFMQNHC